MDTQRPNILILGLAGAGKTTLAHKLASKLGYEVVSLDTYRYGPGWKKRDFMDFRESVLNAVRITSCPKVIESVYSDPSRIAVIRELLPTIWRIYIIEPESLETISSQLIDRCIERAIAHEKGLPTVVETSLDRARLLISNITMYDENVTQLTEFHNEMCLPRRFAETPLLGSIMMSRDKLNELLF